MKKSLTFWQLSGFIIISVFCVLLHLAYDWSNQNIVFALFSAVNESIWEHMKLLFFPMFIFALIESRFLKEKYENFWCIKLVGISLGLTLIPVLYYTYTGVSGVSADWLNIIIFFLTASSSYWSETKLIRSDFDCCLSPTVSLVILCLITLIFVLFTFVPPHIPLFQDPSTMLYGLE